MSGRSGTGGLLGWLGAPAVAVAERTAVIAALRAENAEPRRQLGRRRLATVGARTINYAVTDGHHRSQPRPRDSFISYQGTVIMMKLDYYEEYWSDTGFLPRGKDWPELRGLYRLELGTASKVLDLGCGDAMTSGPVIGELGHTYVGVDVSSAAVTLANASGFNAVLVEDAATLPFRDDDFDAVLCVEVLEHLFDPLAAVQEVRRVLKPGGVLVVTVPNVAHWRSRLDLLCGRFNPRGDNYSVSQPWRDPHIRFFTPKTVNAMLRLGGFQQIRLEGQAGGFLKSLPWLSRNRAAQDCSALYAKMQQVSPSFFGYRIAAVAR